MIKEIKNKNTFIGDLFSKSREYEKKGIDGNVMPFFKRNARRIICSSFSIILVLFCSEGFSKDFLNVTSTVFSILIGLFITVLVFALDKFYEPKEDKTNDFNIQLTDGEIERDVELSISSVHSLSSIEKTTLKTDYNFTKIFSYLIGKNIILSIFTVSLILLNVLFYDFFQLDFYLYSFSWGCDIDLVLNFLLILFHIVFRYFVFYWMLSVFYNTIFVISGLVNFMTIKIDRNL